MSEPEQKDTDEVTGGNVVLIRRLNDQQIIELHRLYQAEWWSRTRTLEETGICVRNSSLVFGADAHGSLIGFARVLTDYIFKAMIFDVIVAASHRGSDIGTFLMESILQDGALRQVRHVELYCKAELRPFYSRWGFNTETGDVALMRLIR